MKSTLLRDESDILLMRNFLSGLPHASTIVDFEENMLLASVRAATRLWRHRGKIIGFAFVDDFNNLWFEIEPDRRSVQLEDEIIAWGIACVRERNAEGGEENTLDASFGSEHTRQIALLERSGFARDSLRTLRYARPLSAPVAEHPFPPGFSLRCVEGEHEVERLVALHRAAFGTDNMTVEMRLAMMRAPQYERELDFLAVAPDGELAAFCVCGFDDEARRVGYTDPIGVHPRYQKLGLGKAMVAAGLRLLRDRGAKVGELGTSSVNIPMQRLAEAMGFEKVSEKLWFTKKV